MPAYLKVKEMKEDTLVSYHEEGRCTISLEPLSHPLTNSSSFHQSLLTTFQISSLHLIFLLLVSCCVVLSTPLSYCLPEAKKSSALGQKRTARLGGTLDQLVILTYIKAFTDIKRLVR